MFRRVVQLPPDENGVTKKQRIYGTAPKHNNTKAAAEQAELEAINRLLYPERYVESLATQRKEAPTFKEFIETRFLEYTEARNKPSEVLCKKSILDRHLIPFFGAMRLDEIRPLQIEDYKREKLKAGRIFKKPAVKTGKKKRAGLSKKTIDNHLIVLRRILNVAKEWELVGKSPKVELYRPKNPDFDFLDFEEAERLIEAAAKLSPCDSRDKFSVEIGDWGRMIVVGLKTGLRIGELLALRWPNVDLKAGKLRVCEAVTRGVVSTPKSGKSRDVPLSTQALAALKAQRHLRGELVFCDMDGNRLTQDQCDKPLTRACARAGLRRITWHVMRHSFASHLVMRGVPLRAVQEFLGHASIEMTMRYAHLAPHVQRQAVQVLDEPAPREETGEEIECETGATRAPWQQNGSK